MQESLSDMFDNMNIGEVKYILVRPKYILPSIKKCVIEFLKNPLILYIFEKYYLQHKQAHQCINWLSGVANQLIYSLIFLRPNQNQISLIDRLANAKTPLHNHQLDNIIQAPLCCCDYPQMHNCKQIRSLLEDEDPRAAIYYECNCSDKNHYKRYHRNYCQVLTKTIQKLMIEELNKSIDPASLELFLIKRNAMEFNATQFYHMYSNDIHWAEVINNNPSNVWDKLVAEGLIPPYTPKKN